MTHMHSYLVDTNSLSELFGIEGVIGGCRTRVNSTGLDAKLRFDRLPFLDLVDVAKFEESDIDFDIVDDLTLPL